MLLLASLLPVGFGFAQIAASAPPHTFCEKHPSHPKCQTTTGTTSTAPTTTVTTAPPPTTTAPPPTTTAPPPTTTAPADTEPPSVPTNQQIGEITQTSARMTWSASTDNVGVTNYNVFRDNVLVAQPVGLEWTYQGLTCGRTYQAGLTAQDAAGNVSDIAQASGPFTTLACDEPPPTTTAPPPTTTAPPPTTTAPPPTETGRANVWVARP